MLTDSANVLLPPVLTSPLLKNFIAPGLVKSLAFADLTLRLPEQTRGGFPRMPVVFQAGAELDPALRSEFVDAIHRSV